jgi:hypothetical protein
MTCPPPKTDPGGMFGFESVFRRQVKKKKDKYVL